MSLFKRAYISIRRNVIKTLILFLIIFLLSVLTSVAISGSSAITNTDITLRQRLPAIATIRTDQENLESFIDEENVDEIERDGLTSELLRGIGELPYVRLFDYVTIADFFSEELVRTFDASLFDMLDYNIEPPVDNNSLYDLGIDWLERFTLTGVYEPNMLDIEANLIDLVAGRVFTVEEVRSGAQVAIVSQSWLNANNLSLGDSFTLQYRIQNVEQFLHALHFDVSEFHSDDNLLASENFDFEIIGVFNHEIGFRSNIDTFHFENLAAIEEHISILNRIYVPTNFNESLIGRYDDVWGGDFPEGFELTDPDDEILHYSAIFLLYDPLDLEEFKQAVLPLLPEFLMVDVATHTYADFSSSMEMIRGIPTLLTIGAVFASTIILCLLIFLFLYDRKYEIGLYLALGEQKLKIFFQFIIEILLIVPVTITLGLIIGNLLSNILSTNLIRQEVLNYTEPQHIATFWPDSPAKLGFRHDMTPEEIVEAFDTSLDIYTIVIFYGTSLVIIVFSASSSILYALKLSPKFILMKGAIG